MMWWENLFVSWCGSDRGAQESVSLVQWVCDTMHWRFWTLSIEWHSHESISSAGRVPWSINLHPCRWIHSVDLCWTEQVNPNVESLYGCFPLLEECKPFLFSSFGNSAFSMHNTNALSGFNNCEPFIEKQMLNPLREADVENAYFLSTWYSVVMYTYLKRDKISKLMSKSCRERI